MSRRLDTLDVFCRAILDRTFSSFPAQRLRAVDATAGNGNDTLYLADAVGASGRVWAFDVQEPALRRTAARLNTAGLAARVTLVHAGHETVGAALPGDENIHAAMFNLGFLPGSDRSVTTSVATSIAALDALSQRMVPGGVISVHCYHGHAGGAVEGEAVAAWLAALPWKAWRVARYAFANKTRNSEALFLAERRL